MLNHTADMAYQGRGSGMSAHSSSTPKSGRIHYAFRKEKPRLGSMLEPFPEKNSYEDSKKVETKIKQEREVLELWKLKIDEHKEWLQKAYESHRKAPISSRLSRDTNGQPVSHRKDEPSERTAMDFGPEHERMFELPRSNRVNVEEVANRNRNRKRILASIIRRRSSRYVRQKGMKIIVPFDPEEAAKKLMEGRLLEDQVVEKEEEVYDDASHYELPVLEGPPRRVPNTTDYGV